MTKNVGVWMTPDLYDRLSKEADRKQMTRGMFLRYLLAQWIEFRRRQEAEQK